MKKENQTNKEIEEIVEIRKDWEKFVRGEMLKTNPQQAEYVIANWWLAKMKAYIQAVEERVNGKVIEVINRHIDWKPTQGYESEEEKGYQKGLIAEAKLIKSDIEALNKPNK